MKYSSLVFVALLAGFSGTATNVSAAPQVITVTASNWKFAPAQITVQAGSPVTIRLTSAEGVHGFQSSDLGIAQTMITPGASKDVTFTPSKPGTYTIHCSMFCGPGHSDMAIVVKVVAS